MNATSYSITVPWPGGGLPDVASSALGEAAFEGKPKVISAALARGINWAEEKACALDGAIYGHHLDLARALLKAGSPVERTTYFAAFHFLPELIEELPPEPALIAKIQAESRWRDFSWALVHEDVETARALLKLGVPINDRITLTHGMGDLCPIHYAVRNGNMALIKILVAAGADVNMLSDRGKSPLRLLAENKSLQKQNRVQAMRFLRSRGARLTPGISPSWITSCRLLLGWPIEESA